jgi:hypothetical protein
MLLQLELPFASHQRHDSLCFNVLLAFLVITMCTHYTAPYCSRRTIHKFTISAATPAPSIKLNQLTLYGVLHQSQRPVDSQQPLLHEEVEAQER